MYIAKLGLAHIGVEERTAEALPQSAALAAAEHMQLKEEHLHLEDLLIHHLEQEKVPSVLPGCRIR